MRETLEMSVQLSKDHKWKEKESDNLYYIPFFIYAAWNAILFGFISTGIIEINKSLPPIANLIIFLAVGILSFIGLIRYFLYCMVYSKTEEIPIFNYSLGSVLSLVILIILLFIDQYQWMIKETTSLLMNFL
ncbi:prenyltransferase [Bacillus thuringiensis]|uniref:prenyltransferase n=1 Tax=Bacillus thuringiensis TaxID=1428 RepID=UPI0021B3600A|nr:prenyltransferase [Bacillus thuringiensis]